MHGNLLGCSDLTQIQKLLSADSTWKRRFGWPSKIIPLLCHLLSFLSLISFSLFLFLSLSLSPRLFTHLFSALEAGYLRPFLLLVSMHPRQRLGLPSPHSPYFTHSPDPFPLSLSVSHSLYLSIYLSLSLSLSLSPSQMCLLHWDSFDVSALVWRCPQGGVGDNQPSDRRHSQKDGRSQCI
jgi:hypothetical protein